MLRFCLVVFNLITGLEFGVSLGDSSLELRVEGFFVSMPKKRKKGDHYSERQPRMSP